jgi:hypothetical protein
METERLIRNQNPAGSLDKRVVLFTLIGILLGFLLSINEIHFGIKFWPISGYSNLFGIFFGIIFSLHLTLLKNKLLNLISMAMTFTISGVAYGALLDLRFFSNQGVSDIPFNILLIPIAISIFIYLITASFLALGEYFRMALLITTALAIPVFILSFDLSLYLFALPSLLVLVSFLTLAINHLHVRSIFSIVVNLLVFFLAYVPFLLFIVVLPVFITDYVRTKEEYLFVVSAGSVILPFLRAVSYSVRRFEPAKDNSLVMTPAVDVSWIISSASLVCNYTIIFSPISILSYQQSVKLLKELAYCQPGKLKFVLFYRFPLS